MLSSDLVAKRKFVRPVPKKYMKRSREYKQFTPRKRTKSPSAPKALVKVVKREVAKQEKKSLDYKVFRRNAGVAVGSSITEVAYAAVTTETGYIRSPMSKSDGTGESGLKIVTHQVNALQPDLASAGGVQQSKREGDNCYPIHAHLSVDLQQPFSISRQTSSAISEVNQNYTGSLRVMLCQIIDTDTTSNLSTIAAGQWLQDNGSAQYNSPTNPRSQAPETRVRILLDETIPPEELFSNAAGRPDVTLSDAYNGTVLQSHYLFSRPEVLRSFSFDKKFHRPHPVKMKAGDNNAIREGLLQWVLFWDDQGQSLPTVALYAKTVFTNEAPPNAA